MDKLLRQIVLYLEFIDENTELDVSVHFSRQTLKALPKKAIEAILPFNSHDNPYCINVKRNSWSECVLSQEGIIKNCITDECFIRTCHAGVTEEIHPIINNSVCCGFVAVSGYRKAEIFPQSENYRLWKDSLSDSDIPVISKTIIPPLCIMIQKFVAEYSQHFDDEYGMMIQFLNEYHTNVTLDLLCKHFGRSKSHISHLFKTECGMSIRAYCNNLKLEDSKKLLTDTELQVTEVAFEVGFSDVSYFIRLFKEKYGISPLKYRKDFI